LAGFYLAAVGAIEHIEHPTMLNFVLLIGLTVVLWLVDLRTRQLLANLVERGKKIETEYWRYSGWISHMNDTAKVKWFIFEIRVATLFVNHSLGFDFMFLFILGYSIYSIYALFVV
jgi:hypothetical protein